MKNTQEKRLQSLKAAGINTENMLAMKLAGNATVNENSTTVPEDNVEKTISDNGTIPERRLFRRWIMSQMFRLMTDKDIHRGIIYVIEKKGMLYSWRMIAEEMKVQHKLWVNKDYENYRKRNRWFNGKTLERMWDDSLFIIKYFKNSLAYLEQLPSIPNVDINGSPFKLRKQSAYISKICLEAEKSLPLRNLRHDICSSSDYWILAYLGVGSFFTMENLIRFHNCTFKLKNRTLNTEESLKHLNLLAKRYAKKQRGLKMYFTLCELMRDNNIDIKKKQQEWAKKATV